MHDSIKMNHLLEWAKARALNKKELNFIMAHLPLDQRQQFQKLFKLKPLVHSDHGPLVPSYRRHTLTIYNCVGFCAELAVAYGRENTSKRVAVLDTDRLNPQLHFYLNCDSHVKNMYHHLSRDQSTGMNLLIDALHKNKLSATYADHMAIKLKGLRNVFYFSGSSLIEDYEYFDLKDFKAVVTFLKAHYDIVLLNTNGFIYDAYTCYALMTSDLNILALEGQWPSVKNLKKTMDFLCLKQNIDSRKHYYLMYDYDKAKHISKRSFQILMKGQYLKNVPYLALRHLSQERVYRPVKKYRSKLRPTYQGVIKDIDRGMRKYELSQKSSH